MGTAQLIGRELADNPAVPHDAKVRADALEVGERMRANHHAYAALAGEERDELLESSARWRGRCH